MLREILHGRVRSVRPLRVVEDGPAGTAAYLVPDSQVAWPRLLDGEQSQTPDQGWLLRTERWYGPGSLFLLEPGTAWAAVLFVDRGTRRPLSWKIDFMAPPRRTPDGYETLDWGLDLLVPLDRREWTVKDRDDLAALHRLDRLGASTVARVTAALAAAEARLGDPDAGPLARSWHAWASWEPPAAAPSRLPAGFQQAAAGDTADPIVRSARPDASASAQLARRHRAIRSVGPGPLVHIASASGHRVLDVDGHSLLDVDLAGATLVCGHAHPSIVEAVTRQAALGLSSAPGHEYEIALAERLIRRFWDSPTRQSAEVVWAPSGEAALRWAVEVGRSRAAPATGGIQRTGAALRSRTVASWTQPFGDADHVALAADAIGAQRQLAIARSRLAAIVVDPLALADLAVDVSTAEALVSEIRSAQRAGALLIADERRGLGIGVAGGVADLAPRLAAPGLETSALVPDLVVFGEALFGGLPGGAVLCPTDLHADPGAASPNPMAAASALETLEQLDPASLQQLAELGDRLRQRWATAGVGPLARIPPGGSPARWAELGVLVGRDGWASLATVATADDVELLLSAASRL